MYLHTQHTRRMGRIPALRLQHHVAELTGRTNVLHCIRIRTDTSNRRLRYEHILGVMKSYDSADSKGIRMRTVRKQLTEPIAKKTLLQNSTPFLKSRVCVARVCSMSFNRLIHFSSYMFVFIGWISRVYTIIDPLYVQMIYLSVNLTQKRQRWQVDETKYSLLHYGTDRRWKKKQMIHSKSLFMCFIQMMY